MKNQAPQSATSNVRVLLVDDHLLFRAGMKLLICEKKGYLVVGEASSRTEALALVKSEEPDIILLSSELNESGALEMIPELFAAYEESRVLVLTGSRDPEINRRAVVLGAMGVISKEKPAETLMKAIEKIHLGEAWLDRFLTASLLGELSPRKKKPDPQQQKIESLTQREREVIKLVGEGLKNKQIAERLFISDITVHHHLTSVYSKLEVTDRLELLIYAYRNGLADIPR